MNQDKDYFAFISYQRKDEEWADWLRNKLEHYRLPSSVRKKDASLPKEIRPIFRDALELAGGVLAKEIETALQNSKFLIVICSPNSAKSPWVNKEIQTFIELGREDRIIPFIIDGTPSSDNEDTECFPPALRSLKGEKELLGININELSRDAASIKVVARMFGLKFDTLWQRYEREKKRKRWMIVGGALLFAFVSLGIGGYFVRQNRIIESQNERLQQDSVTIAEHLTRIQNDSIKLSVQNDSMVLQNNLIISQRDSIAHSIQQIKLSNRLLTEERDNVLKANWQAKENYARAIAKEASRVCAEGNAYGAITLLLDVIPNKDNNYNYPSIPEVEASFRQANDSILYSRGSIGQIRKHHRAEVMSISMSKTGKMVTGYNTCEACVWNLHTGHEDEKMHIQLNDRCTNTLISSDGNIIYAGGKGELKTKIINSAGTIEETTITNNFDGLSNNVLHMSIGSDFIVYKDLDGYYRFVNTNTLEEFWEIGNLRQLVLTPDSKYAIALSNDKTVCIWNIKKKMIMSSFSVECNIYWADISISADGKHLKIEDPQETNIWDLRNGCKEMHFISCTFPKSTNNAPVLGSLGVETSIEDSVFRVHVHENGNISIYKKIFKNRLSKERTYSTNSLLFNRSLSNAIPYYYNEQDNLLVINGKEVTIPFDRCNEDIFLSCGPGYDINESLSRLVIYYPMNSNAYVWSLKEYKVDGKLSHESVIKNVSFSCNSEYVITQTEDGYTHFWNTKGYIEDFCIKTGYLRNLDLSYDNRFAYNLDPTVTIWDTRKNEQIPSIIQIESDNPSSIFLNTHNTQFITSDNNVIQLWDFKTGIELWKYYINNPDCVNNKYYVNFCEGGIRILNKEYGKSPKSFFMELDNYNVLVNKYREIYGR